MHKALYCDVLILPPELSPLLWLYVQLMLQHPVLGVWSMAGFRFKNRMASYRSLHPCCMQGTIGVLFTGIVPVSRSITQPSYSELERLSCSVPFPMSVISVHQMMSQAAARTNHLQPLARQKYLGTRSQPVTTHPPIHPSIHPARSVPSTPTRSIANPTPSAAMASVFAANNTALITGGASGIGLAVAQLCRKHGMKVALCDNNAAYLSQAKQTLGAAAQSDGVETFEIDVGKIEEWRALRGKVQERFGRVDLLMLNAGVGLKGGWEDTEYFHKVRMLGTMFGPGVLGGLLVLMLTLMQIMDTNLFGVIHGLNTFVPVIQAQQRQGAASAVVITGSKQGITNPPGNPAYNASKAAVKALAEHLSYDMRGTSTSVHLLVPGWTFTGLV